MSWFAGALGKIKETTSTAPIECPRGWGPVTFTLSLSGMLPWMEVSRQCPIGGVESCASCRYAVNPERVERLRECIAELDRLRKDGTLTTEEHAAQRERLLDLRAFPDDHDEGLILAAWIVGPVGIAIAGMGYFLTLKFHPGFWALVAVGPIAVAVAVGIALAVASSRRKAAASRRDIHRDPYA